VPARLRPGASQIARLTAAAVFSYLAANASPRILDLTAPLTALLVVQASTLGTLRMGLVRVGAVLRHQRPERARSAETRLTGRLVFHVLGPGLGQVGEGFGVAVHGDNAEEVAAGNSEGVTAPPSRLLNRAKFLEPRHFCRDVVGFDVDVVARFVVD
jgi:hypothetical protein